MMQHLKKEFAMENLMFLTIMWQFRDLLLKNGFFPNEKDAFVLGNDEWFKLPQNVPISNVFTSNVDPQTITITAAK